MPVEGRTIGQASRTLTDQLNRTLNSTVTHTRLSFLLVQPSWVVQIAFRHHGRESPAILRTTYGRMELDLLLTCSGVQDEDRNVITLRQDSYRYTIMPDSAAEPLLRWEYVRFPNDPDATWCRHHFQGPIRLGIHDREGEEANLNQWHLPTSGIAIEEVLRFCVTDLGVQPLGDDWNQQLRL